MGLLKALVLFGQKVYDTLFIIEILPIDTPNC